MNIRIGICDDSGYELKIIRQKVKNVADSMGCFAEILLFQSSAQILNFIEREPDFFDLLFLDLYIDEKMGFEVAEAVRKKKTLCAIIFITAFREQMNKSFRYLVSGYLIKPVDESSVREAFENALKHLKMEPVLHISVKEKEYKIPYASIMYLENKSKSVYVFLENRKEPLELPLTLSHIPKLPDKYFYFCHKSFIVNFMYVSELDKKNHQLILKNHQRISISRTFYSGIIQKFMQYHSMSREVMPK